MYKDGRDGTVEEASVHVGILFHEVSHHQNDRVVGILYAKEQLEERIVEREERLEVVAQVVVHAHQRLHDAHARRFILQHAFALLVELVLSILIFLDH